MCSNGKGEEGELLLRVGIRVPSVKDIMDKYYEMFRGKSQNKKDFFNSPDSPEHSDQDSDAGG